MAAGGWREFRYHGVRFDILEGRLIRMRCRDLDKPGYNAYLIVDVLTLKPLPEPEYRPARIQRQRASAAD